MSILFEIPVSRTKQTTKLKVDEPRTSSIMLISMAIFTAIILLMFVGIALTDGVVKVYSTCRDKVMGYEQHGIYANPEQFGLVLSYCGTN